jgi:hypothetical protein
MKPKHTCVLIGLIITLLGCTPQEETISNQVTADTLKTIDAAIQPPSAEDTYAGYDDESELNYIVTAGEGYNYDSLKSVAMHISTLLHFKMDSLGRYYNRKKESIVVPEDDADEMYAGVYYLRRTGEDFVSIEMSYAYADTSIIHDEIKMNALNSDTTKMFVFVNMYTNKASADSLAQIVRRKYSLTKVIPVRVYMGCMH